MHPQTQALKAIKAFKALAAFVYVFVTRNKSTLYQMCDYSYLVWYLVWYHQDNFVTSFELLLKKIKVQIINFFSFLFLFFFLFSEYVLDYI